MRARSTSLALLLVTLGCSYSPSFQSGTLQCSDTHTCPQGYYCLTADNTCWKKGTAPSDGGAGGTGGSRDGGSDAGPDAGNPRSKFLGRWVYDSTSKLDETCTAMAAMTSSLANDYVDITAGTTSDLIGTYYCAWNLNLVAGDPTKAAIVAGQSCQTTSGGMAISMHGDAFDFASADGVTGTLSAQFTATYVTGPALTCVFKITGKLTLMP